MAEIGQVAGRPLPPDRAAGQRRDGDHLPRHRYRPRSRRRAQAAPARIPPRPRLLGALPAGGAGGRLAEPPERRHRLRLRRGPERPVHRHGAGRRRGPRDDPAPERGAAAAPGRPDRGRRRPGPRRGPCPRPRPPRHQAGQRADRRRRPGQGRRLRHRPGDRRGAGDAARDDPRLGPLLQPGTGARRAGDGRLGHLQPRHRPVRDARPASRPWEGDSAASVALARLSGPIPDPMAVRPSVPPDLAAITRRALALDPKDRWASASVMADALEATLAPGRRRRGRRGGRGRPVCAGRHGRLRHGPAEPGGHPVQSRTPTSDADRATPVAPASRRRCRRPSSTRTKGRARSCGSPGSSPSCCCSRSRSSSSSSCPVRAGRRGRAGHGAQLRGHDVDRRRAAGPEPRDHPQLDRRRVVGRRPRAPS